VTPEARLLRYFLAVAEEGNFTRAAARLHIAQPALSTQIRRLESQLGVRLLVRTTRVVEITEAGQAVLERGPAALAALEDVWESARRAGRGELGRLRLLYSASTGYGTVPQLVEALCDRYPQIHVGAEVMRTPDIAQAVADGRADVGVARMPAPLAGVRLRPLRQEPRGLLFSADHPLAGAEAADLAAVADYPVLVHAREANPAHYDELMELFERAGLRPEFVERPVSFDPTRRLLRGGRAVGVVGRPSAEDLADSLRWVPLTDVPPLLVQLVLPTLAVSPPAARFEEVAQATAEREGWLTP
jgi:DNA-binding transcriptional LysR family regulator